MIGIDVENNMLALLDEKEMSKYNDDTCPRELDSCNLSKLLYELKQEEVSIRLNLPNYMAVFIASNDDTSKIIRAIQEDQLLKTKIKLWKKNQTIILKSFWEVWNSSDAFRNQIISSPNPNEEKWKLCRKYGYKLATTFMPSYSKAIYEYFGSPEIVLDPCCGWGDRLLGAEVAGVKKYIGYDPNLNLRPGYAEIMSLCGHQPCELSSNYIGFSNTYQIHSLPFEIGSSMLERNSVDFIFTSPPFFDYEIYSNLNPTYTNWIKEFYKPLFKECSRIIKPNGYVCIYLSDTSAGEIEEFMKEKVEKITKLKLQQKHIGFKGLWSNEIRKIWVFKKSE